MLGGRVKVDKMKVPKRSAIHPSISCRKILLCVALLYSVLQSTQQQVSDIRQPWKNVSHLFPINFVYEQQHVTSLSSKDSADAPQSLNKNNVVMKSSNLGTTEDDNDNVDEDTYSDEYDDESQSEILQESKNISFPKDTENTTMHTMFKKSPQYISSDTRTKQEMDDEHDDYSTSQYNEYYYYEDYDNYTDPQYVTVGNLDYTDNDFVTVEETSSGTIMESTLSESGSLMEGSETYLSIEQNPSNKVTDKSILIGEAVVSVVTTKSVVNGTISVPVTSLPITAEQILAPPTSFQRSTTEQSMSNAENSMVIASVQTSRSISGARFLPFPVVERMKPLAPSSNGNINKKMSGLPESTESIIDKLDRVQSELSSGFLTGGFRNTGNTLQLDVLSERDQARRRLTTTAKMPVISKFVPHRYNGNKRADISTTISSSALSRSRGQSPLDNLDGLLPPDFPLNRTLTRTTVKKPSVQTTPITTNSRSNGRAIFNNAKNVIVEEASTLLPSGYKLRKEIEVVEKSPQTTVTATDSKISLSHTTVSSNTKHLNVQDILPPGYKLKKEDAEVTEKSILNDILAKSKVNISLLLPSDYGRKTVNDLNVTKNKSTSESNGQKAQSKAMETSVQDIFAKSKVDISSLLPRDYIQKKGNSSSLTISKQSNKDHSGDKKDSVMESMVFTTPRAGGLKIVFPSRLDGRKATRKITTPHTLRGEAPAAFTPRIQKGWPTRATTEFTGWPTPSTTPISIEKLLEAARTATITHINVSSSLTPNIAPTTLGTTTTTVTPRPTTPGICEEECEVAGTIRIVDNATWVPELLDRNTYEWQQLANEVENEINFVFSKSAVLKKWYKKIKIDSFSQGSILVDYFIELSDLRERVNTQELKTIFHDSLRAYNSNRESETKSKIQLKLGTFAIDPKFTDFIVLPKVITPQHVENDDRLIPQWAIAVIVIGVGGLLFIIVFGVSVLINRQNVSKLKPSMSTMYEEEVAKNIIHTNHVSPAHRFNDYPKEDVSTFWNDMDTVWNDKSFESTSNKILVDGPIQNNKRYNLYDSWRSEWNGHYYNPSHTSRKSVGYDSTTNLSHHHPNYDTNF